VTRTFHSHFRRLFDESFLSVARNSSWSIGTTAVTAVAFFVETVVLARHFGRTTYGVYLLVIAYPEAVQLFLDFRTREAMTRYLGGFLARDEKDEAVAVVKLLWVVDLCVVTLAYVIVFVTAPFVAPHLTDDPSSTELMRVYGVAMALGGLAATAGSILRVFDRFRLSFLTGAGAVTLRELIIIGLVAGGAGLEGVILGRVVTELAATAIIGSAAFMLLKGALWPQRRARIDSLGGQKREIVHFLLHMNVQGSLKAAASKLDVLAVGALGGPGTASLYKIGVQFGSSPLLLADPLFSSVYPLFARLHALGDNAQIRAIGRRASIVLGVVALPVAILLAVWSETIITFLVGESFSAAWLPMVIVLFGVLPAVLLFWGRAAMLAFGDAMVATKIIGTSLVVQFALLLALVRPLGATGAALGFAGLFLVSAIMTFEYLRRRELL
jgi:O-antigen/teichoic acid export membrane protein